jgi:hypothetical protein
VYFPSIGNLLVRPAHFWSLLCVELLSDGASEPRLVTESAIVDLFQPARGPAKVLEFKQHGALEGARLPDGLYRAVALFLAWQEQKKAADRLL